MFLENEMRKFIGLFIFYMSFFGFFLTWLMHIFFIVIGEHKYDLTSIFYGSSIGGVGFALLVTPLHWAMEKRRSSPLKAQNS